jgi:hypothetical protein
MPSAFGKKKYFFFFVKALQSTGVVIIISGANPTIVIYNAGVVKIFNSTTNIARLLNTN